MFFLKHFFWLFFVLVYVVTMSQLHGLYKPIKEDDNMMNLEECRWKWSQPILKQCLSIHLNLLRKTRKIFTQDSHSLGKRV
jgi:hypothetical protein